MAQREKGKCPVCKGTTRVAADPTKDAKYFRVYSSYDEATHTLNCGNCGSQYMFGRPTGETYLNKDGEPCTHKYTSETVGRCYHKYTCINCGDTFHIDSGD